MWVEVQKTCNEGLGERSEDGALEPTDTYGHLRALTNADRHLWTSMDICEACGHLWAFTDAYMDAYGHLQTFEDTCGNLRTPRI